MRREIDLEDPELQDALGETERLAALGSRSVPAVVQAVRHTATLPPEPSPFIAVEDGLNLVTGELNFGGVETTLNDTERTAVLRIIVKACKRAITERAKRTQKENVA